jgi:hypothetical protein
MRADAAKDEVINFRLSMEAFYYQALLSGECFGRSRAWRLGCAHKKKGRRWWRRPFRNYCLAQSI